MNRKSDNIEIWIGRAFICLFFIFFTLSFSSNGYSNSEADTDAFTVEQLVHIDNAAILVEPTNVPGNHHFLVYRELYGLKIQNVNLGIPVLKFAIQQQFKQQKLRFFNCKPKLLESQLISSKEFSDEEELMIS